ncbi:MAG: ABC transporter ATP-binding protein [Candidatus Omnitrophica bacterium CG12_big_fil_rev_8_21_14_0_65_50_5]|nr:MAG: ABC transporter ATP-binding protein [Candidatus Omnitrophica bacterium CG12_big_fil_rev_8_21_14_0_65_50_5]
MIRIISVSKSFDDNKVLDHLSLEIPQGQIITILGESGTGKSVLLRHLVGLMRPDEGSIEIGERDLTKLSEREMLELRKTIGYLFQEGALFDFMTVFENVAFPLQEHTKMSRKEIMTKVQDMLNIVDLPGVEEKMPAELSGGMRKRVGLARAMVLGSEILVCDEPTSGLDPIRSRDISDLIRQVTRKLKCTTVIASHDVHNSLRVSDRLVLIRDGKIVLDAPPKGFQSSEIPFVKEFMD